MRRAVTIMMALMQVSCGPHPSPNHGPAPPPEPSAELLASLTLPAGDAAGEAIKRLMEYEQKGSCRSAWIKLRYLIDLFDAVRLLPEHPQFGDPALGLLWRGLGLTGEPARGRLATRQVLDRIVALAEIPLLRRCAAEHVDTVLELFRADQAPRATVAQALKLVVTYKKIARSDSQLAPNAQLRLVDWCAKAFRLAAGGAPALQRARLNQCLFPLFDADPSPYFHLDPSSRPPDPPWPVLRDSLSKARDRLLSTRIKPIAAQLTEEDRSFFAEAAPVLPTPLDLTVLEPPTRTDGTPWDRTPVVAVTSRGYMVGGVAVLEGDKSALEQAIARRLHNDQRRRITVVAKPSCPAARLLFVGRAARRAGARIMDLGVVRKVAERAPAGDVQRVVLGEKRPVVRLEGIPVYLGLLSATSPAGIARDLPRGLGYDPRTAQGGLVVLIRRSKARAFSNDGSLSEVEFEALSGQLSALKRSYPEDRSIVLAPSSEADNAGLVTVAGLARGIFPGLALSTVSRVAVPEEDLAALNQLLAGARVRLTPQGGDPAWPHHLRTCYLSILRSLSPGRGRRRPPRGTVTLMQGAGGIRVIGGTLRHRGLRKCIRDKLKGGAQTNATTRFTAVFSLK